MDRKEKALAEAAALLVIATALEVVYTNPKKTILYRMNNSDDAPLISVLLSVYNGERFLVDCLNSILNQTIECFEFLIVNDGSTDNTKSILEDYSEHEKINIINNEKNSGLAASLNIAIRESKGQYIARIDADDLAETNRLEKQANFLLKNPKYALVGASYKVIDESGIELNRCSPPTDNSVLRWHLQFYCPFVHSGIMFDRRKVLESVGYYSENYNYSMDYDLWLRVSRKHHVGNLPEYLVSIRRNPQSLTSSRPDISDEGRNLRIKNLKCNLIHVRGVSTDNRLLDELFAFHIMQNIKGNLSLSRMYQLCVALFRLRTAIARKHKFDSERDEFVTRGKLSIIVAKNISKHFGRHFLNKI